MFFFEKKGGAPMENFEKFGNAKVLIVYAEDDAMVREAVLQRLNYLGFTQIFEAWNGSVARGKCEGLLRRNKNVILLTDNQMPDVTGEDLIFHFRAEENKREKRRMCLIMISGDYPSQEAHRQTDHFFLKSASLFEYLCPVLRKEIENLSQ
jgi:CheY-like chemotaxis protein